MQISSERSRKELIEKLGDYEEKYSQKLKELEGLSRNISDEVAECDQQIIHTKKLIDILNNKQLDAALMTGLQGRTLIDCLINVRTLAMSHPEQASAYAPLISILNGNLNYLVKS